MYVCRKSFLGEVNVGRKAVLLSTGTPQLQVLSRTIVLVGGTKTFPRELRAAVESHRGNRES